LAAGLRTFRLAGTCDKRPRFLAAQTSAWDHLPVEQDDPEKRIADLERQLGEQRRGADLPPGAPDRPQAGRRFKVAAMSKPWQLYSLVGLMFLGVGVIAAEVSGGRPSVPLIVSAVVFFLILSLAGQWAFGGGRKVVICAMTDGLTISKRPGDVFSFRDAELGQWRKTGGRFEYVGRALFLTSGPHRFVLGGDFKNPSNPSQVPVEGPQVKARDLDAWSKSKDFDELLAIVGAKRGPDLPITQPGQQANGAAEGGRGGRRVASIVQFVAIFCLVAGVNIFGTGAILVYEDSLGTPTTATIDHCHQGVGYQTCYAKWSIGGVSQTGPIRGRVYGDHPVGSQLNVHVRGGSAYQPRASTQKIWRIGGGFAAIATGVVLYWAARRKIRTGRWPWSGPQNGGGFVGK
jgi:hypothetical protein